MTDRRRRRRRPDAAGPALAALIWAARWPPCSSLFLLRDSRALGGRTIRPAPCVPVADWVSAVMTWLKVESIAG